MVPRLIRRKLERLESNINKMQLTIAEHCPKERHVDLTREKPKSPKVGRLDRLDRIDQMNQMARQNK